MSSARMVAAMVDLHRGSLQGLCHGVWSGSRRFDVLADLDCVPEGHSCCVSTMTGGGHMSAVELLIAWQYPGPAMFVGIVVSLGLAIGLLVPFLLKEIRKGKVN